MSRRTARSPIAFVMAPLLAAIALASGCKDDRLGAPCTLAGATEPAPTVSYVDENAVACPSRICLLPAAQITTDTQALCSVECQTDADCQGGQRRDSRDATDKRCSSGFSCQPIVPVLSSAAGPQPCQKLCACRDFLDVTAAALSAGCP